MCKLEPLIEAVTPHQKALLVAIFPLTSIKTFSISIGKNIYSLTIERMGKNDDELTSQIISSYSILYMVLAIAAGLLLVFPSYAFLLVFPYVLLCVKGMHSSITSGLMVAVIWGTWLSLVFSPVIILSPGLIYLSLYAPLIFMSRKNTKKQPSQVEYSIQCLIWEIPLFIWIQLYSLLGWRALDVSLFHKHVHP